MDNMSEEKIDELIAGIAELRDLFVRRLMDDKVKNNAIEKLAVANKDLIKSLEGAQLNAIAKDLFLLCDRIYQQPKEDDFAWSMLDEILEILARRGIEPINKLDKFDPSLHNIISTVHATSEVPAGTIVEIRRHGYIKGQHLLRPADVVIAK